MSGYSCSSNSPSPSHRHHPVNLLHFASSDFRAAIQPRYNNIDSRPAHNNNPSVGPGNRFNPSSISNNTVPPNSNNSGTNSNGHIHHLSIEESLIDHQYSSSSTPLHDPLRETSAANHTAASTASHLHAETPANGLDGMTSHTNISPSAPTSGLPFDVSSTPDRPVQLSAQSSHLNRSLTPPSPIGTQSSDEHPNIPPTLFFLPPPNMTHYVPLLAPIPPVPPQTGASIQPQAIQILHQQHTQHQITNFDDDYDGDDDRRDDPVVCVVCGGICKVTLVSNNNFNNFLVTTPKQTPDWMRPILVQATPKYLEWQKKRLSTRIPYHESAKLIEKIQVTVFLGGSQGMKSGLKRLHINTMDSLMKIPIHKACFKITKIFCKDQSRYSIGFRSASGGAPSSIPQLYEIWCKRAIASHPGGLMSKPILEANKYYGAPVYGSMAAYHRAMQKDPSMSRFLANPLAISNLTDIVVNSNLQTMDGKVDHASSELDGLLSRIQDLPQEIADQITAALEPFEEGRGPPLQATRVLPSNWWKEMLLSGKLIPWLWDLKEGDISSYRVRNFYKDNPNDALKDQKRGTYIFDENMWDWELLCRQLAQSNVMQETGILAGKSDQLGNRRRIWKLLDAARLGHIQFPQD